MRTRTPSAEAMTMTDNTFGFLIIAAILLISIYTIYQSILMKHKTDRQERSRER